MARITAVIDIGSNSMRMVVMERTSRFGFRLLKEVKSRVRISEGAYENSGILQPSAVSRAVEAMRSFKEIAVGYKARKILCVATSAVRDAPNRSDFLRQVRQNTNIEIRVIDGEKEAYYGALSALNLLPIQNGITVDIGGGSTELGLIKNGKIEGLISLNLGTVRLKELVFDKNLSLQDAIKQLQPELSRIPENFKADTIIGIGGTNRALAGAIMKQTNYPIDVIHAFSFSWIEQKNYIEQIINSKQNRLKMLGIKPDRFDVIREGALIMKCVADIVGGKNFMASGGGVREGVFLADILRSCGHKFPPNLNPSVRSLLDRYCTNEDSANYIRQSALKLFDVLKPLHWLSSDYEIILNHASKLANIGENINFYSHRHHSYYILLNNLDYGLTHTQKLLIASIVKYHGKRFGELDNDEFYPLLADKTSIVKWLSVILTVAECLNSTFSKPKWDAKIEGRTLVITSNDNFYLAKERIAAMVKED
ncbi:MAG: hypothetical protein RL154_1535 [Pseudomonadota bacterium]